MDSKTLKELAGQIGAEIRDQVGVAHDRIDELASDVAALPEVRHGVDGKDGEKGERGEKGEAGESIVGPQGEQGPAGESIVGPQGEKGEKGDAGESIVGPQGEKGEKGEKGDPGESIVGPQGEQGIQGEAGEKGDTGTGIDVPFWSADAVYREGVEVQHHFGQFFRAKKDTAESPDDPESWERVGSSGFRLTGPFSKDAEYRDGDLFVKDFGLFLHSSGKSTLIAGRGPEGKRGKAGVTGRDGKDGADGKDGKDGADGSVIEALELRGANLVAVFKNAEGEYKDHSVSLEPFLQTAALVTKEAAATEKKSIIEEADEYVRKLWNSLSTHLDAEDATPISFYRGIWRMDASYQVGDWVRYGSEGLICKRANTGIVPHNYPTSTVDSSEYWQAITGLPSHGVGTAGDGSGGSGVTPTDVMVKEGGQGGIKFSQFPLVQPDPDKQLSVVGLRDGSNVKAVLTTDLVQTNPEVIFRDAKGRFKATPEELENLTNQMKVNRWFLEKLESVEAGEIDLSGYATTEQLVEAENASIFRDETIKTDLEDKDKKQTAAILVVESDVRNVDSNSRTRDNRLQADINEIELALETILLQRTHGQWRYVGFSGDNTPRNAGEFALASDDLSASSNVIVLNQQDLGEKVHGFGDVEVGDYVEIVDREKPDEYALFVVDSVPDGSGIVSINVKLKDKGNNFLVGTTCEIRFFQINQQQIDLTDLDSRYLKLTGGEMTGDIRFNGNRPSISYRDDQGQNWVQFSIGKTTEYKGQYATDDAIATKKRITAAVAGLASEEWVTEEIGKIDIPDAGKPALSLSFRGKSEVSREYPSDVNDFCPANANGQATNNMSQTRMIRWKPSDGHWAWDCEGFGRQMGTLTFTRTTGDHAGTFIVEDVINETSYLLIKVRPDYAINSFGSGWTYDCRLDSALREK